MRGERGVTGGMPCAKGAIPYCLDEFSKGRGARSRIRRLNDAIAALAPSYAGLERVFDEHLFAHVMTNAAERRDKVAQLKDLWFGPNAATPLYPGKSVARIYAEGVRKALELSLNGRPVVPINAWWIFDASDFRMLTLADIDKNGGTVGGRVTLLIMTPPPAAAGRAIGRGSALIMGSSAQAWESAQAGNRVVTRSARGIR